MPSTFTWLDYSEHERRKMLDVIELFGEKTTRDELGLAGIRDAFADLLFPGTGTVQTRAKYFLFVPWTYLFLEKKRIKSEKVALRDRKLEIELGRQLEATGETDGVIGRIAKEKLQRLPSNIYWQGLYLWGIRTFTGSQDEYHRSLDLFYRRQKARRESRHEHEGETAEDPDLHNWHVGLPHPDEDFPNGESFELSPEQSEYLRERILTNCSQSLLAWLLREHVDVADARFVWDLDKDLPDHLQQEVNHGRNFSEMMLGSQLLYNLILAEKSSVSELVDGYRNDLREWIDIISNRFDELQTWNKDDFWKTVYKINPRISGRARGFVRSWINFVLNAGKLTRDIFSKAGRQLVETREVQLKGGLARVKSDRALELWSGSAGAAQMDLRWGSARRIIVDILTGLEVDVHA